MGFEKPENGLPDNPIITEKMYRDMYRVADTDGSMEVLKTVSQKTKVDYEEADSRLYEKLKDAGLLEMRSAPDGIYYAISSLGEVILERGPMEGVKELMRREEEFEDAYSSDN